MWNYKDCNKIIGTELKVHNHQAHLRNLSKIKSTIKGLSPWKPSHSLSKISNKYTNSKNTSYNKSPWLYCAVKQRQTNKQNTSLLTRMLEIETKPTNNTTNIIPQFIPSNSKTHAIIKKQQRMLELWQISQQNKKIVKRIESASSSYGRDRWKPDWQTTQKYWRNITRKESVPDFASLAKSRLTRPQTASCSGFSRN